MILRCILIAFLFSTQLHAQEAKNMVFLEVLGNGGLVSLNFERQLTNSPGLFIRGGLGVGIFETQRPVPEYCYFCIFTDLPTTDLSLPITLGYLFSIQNHNYIEGSVGYTFQFGKRDGSEFDQLASHAYLLSLGFRRHFGKNAGWMWKINYTPLIGVSTKNQKDFNFESWVGISLGKRF